MPNSPPSEHQLGTVVLGECRLPLQLPVDAPPSAEPLLLLLPLALSPFANTSAATSNGLRPKHRVQRARLVIIVVAAIPPHRQIPVLVLEFIRSGREVVLGQRDDPRRRRHPHKARILRQDGVLQHDFARGRFRA